MTRSELVIELRASTKVRQRERQLATLTAWRTATLVRSKKRIPSLAKLLRERKRMSRRERLEVQRSIQQAEAEFERLEREARKG